jgi:hypothetical protein
MTEYHKNMEQELEEFSNIADFYDDTEAIIIRRFYLLNKKMNEKNDFKIRNKLQNNFGQFLIDRGIIFVEDAKKLD